MACIFTFLLESHVSPIVHMNAVDIFRQWMLVMCPVNARNAVGEDVGSV